ncbi:MAG: aldo/keto reductase, partial [Acidobacteriota bacterium]
MWYRKLGRLGWEVSAISMGTVQFGMPYGFTYDGEAEVPSRNDAVRLLLDAFEAGINLLDTAPTYGAAETIVGEALRQWRGSEIFVATKIPTWGKDPALEVNQSLRRLGRESIDLLQIYSHSDDWDAVLRSLEVALRCLEEGKTRALGISVYDESIALKALDLQRIDTIQLPFNILDQRMA